MRREDGQIPAAIGEGKILEDEDRIVRLCHPGLAALTEFRLKESPPDVIIRPDLPVDMDLLLSFDRPQEAIACGEQAAEAALPQIRALLD